MLERALSVVIITKNEQDRITRCLESVKWADEIIVVDDFSTDKTVEICRKYGAQVTPHDLQENFAQQRNLGIDKAKGSWILQMDADEIVPEELRNEIQKAVSCNSEFSGFQFRRKNFFLGRFMRYGGFYGPYSLKLFKRGKARYVGQIHEELKVDGQIGVIGADIEHYPFQSISQNIERNNIYSTIRAKLMKEEKGPLSEKELRHNLTIRPLKTFWKMYVKKRGYKDGMYGLIFCILFTFGPMLRWMKYWELSKDVKQKASNEC